VLSDLFTTGSPESAEASSDAATEFGREAQAGIYSRGSHIIGHGLAERLTRKPLTAGPEELARNPRSRSAKLRGIRKHPPA
ncbi:MAG: 16S rRNA (cytosine(1402)-N(4))-methyltransferase, partial [Planctomycetota bacterium]